MENVKNLEARLAALLKNEDSVKALKKSGNFAAMKKVHLAAKYLVESGIELAVNGRSVDMAVVALQSESLTEEQKNIVLMKIEYMVLSALKNERDLQSLSFNSKNKKDRKDAEKKAAEISAVAGEILPDYLVMAYSTIKAGEGSGTIKNATGEVVFDFDVFFESVNRSAIKSSVVNNLPAYKQESIAKFKKVVKENAGGFMNIINDIDNEVKAAEIIINNAPSTKRVVNSSIRKIRRENRPVDKKGNLLPSYLDYINDDNTLVRYEDFVKTPTHKIYGEFKTKEDYKAYVRSSAFTSYVGFLETPVRDTDEAAGAFYVMKKYGAPIVIDETKVEITDFPDPSVEVIGQFPKESIVLPQRGFKLAKTIENPTVQISKLSNEKLVEGIKKVAAGALSVVILAHSLGWPVKEVIKSINGAEVTTPNIPEDKPEVENPNGPNGPTTKPNPQPQPPQPEDDNVEIKENPNDIRDNPADKIVPEVDNLGPNGTIIPNVPESEQESVEPDEKPSTPESEETTEEAITESDPSYDQPDADVPEENGAGSDKKGESDEDEFF